MNSLSDIGSAALPLVFLAGLVSFLSPCVLPLLPGYLSYMGGRAAGAAQAPGAPGDQVGPVGTQVRPARAKMLLNTLAFVAGFSVVFIALGMSASVLGQFLAANRALMTRLAGVVIVLMGLLYLGVIPVPWLYSERRLGTASAGAGGPALMGVVFGFGWTPCIGPTLGTALTIAATGADPARGALLLGVYSMGLGVPFVASALAVHKMVGTMAWLRRHQRGLMRAGGVLLIAVGLLFLFNRVFWLSTWMQRAMRSVGLDFWSGI